MGYSSQHYIIRPEKGGWSRKPYSTKDFLEECQNISRSHVKEVGFDMDGVLEPDDVAGLHVSLVDPNYGSELMREFSDMNIELVDQGMTCYCWYVIGILPRYTMMDEYSRILEVIGEHIRLTPGAEYTIESLQKSGFEPFIATAAYQEAAENVAIRLGVKPYRVIATELETRDGKITGRVGKFCGGKKKLSRIIEKFGGDYPLEEIFFVDDSWSGLETMEELPNSLAFNPKYPQTGYKAAINIYGRNLAGVLPFLRVDRGSLDNIDPLDLPEAVVLNGGIDKNDSLVRYECKKATEMRKLIDRDVEIELPREEMVARIADTLKREGLKIPLKDLSNIDTEEARKFGLKEYQRVFGCLTS